MYNCAPYHHSSRLPWAVHTAPLWLLTPVPALHSLSGCDKLSRPGAALGLAPLTQLIDLDLSYIGATPPDDEDVETARELQNGLGGVGYSTWVSSRTAGGHVGNEVVGCSHQPRSSMLALGRRG